MFGWSNLVNIGLLMAGSVLAGQLGRFCRDGRTLTALKDETDRNST
jgi:hypothetical protein